MRREETRKTSIQEERRKEERRKEEKRRKCIPVGLDKGAGQYPSPEMRAPLGSVMH
jgi:hypothetical protein